MFQVWFTIDIIYGAFMSVLGVLVYLLISVKGTVVIGSVEKGVFLSFPMITVWSQSVYN